MDTRPLSNQYTELSRHRRAPSTTSSTIDEVEAYAEQNGIIDLDNPEVKKKTVIADLSNFERARYEAQKERERLEAEAQEKHKQAMLNLKSGTAILRQKSERTKPAKKVEVAKKASVATKPIKAPKPVVKKARKPYYHKPDRLVPSSQVQARVRRKIMLEKLQAGEFLPMQSKQSAKGDFDLYQQQRAAIKKLEKEEGLTVVRIKRISDNQSFFALDDFKRHQIEQKVSGNLDGDDRKDFIKAVASGEVVLASDLVKGARVGVSSTSILARNHGMNIYTVFSGKYVLGWILIDDSANAGKTEVKQRSLDIDDVGDMLEAMDYLQAKQKRNRNDLLPMCVPDVILDAAFREFKRVEKDGQ